MASAVDYDSTGINYYTIPSRFTFSNGQTATNVRVAYRSYNPSSTAGAVLIPTCYAGLINTTLTFTSAPYDSLARYHVVVVAMLGNGESSSPSNQPQFPIDRDGVGVRYPDQIRAQHALLTRHLGVSELEAVLGFSMGGQQAYHWAVMYPDFVKRVVAICSSARTSAHNYAFLEGPVAALLAAGDYATWKNGVEKVQENMTSDAEEGAGEDFHKLDPVVFRFGNEDAGDGQGDVDASASLGLGRDVYVRRRLAMRKPEQGLKAFARAYGAWLSSHWWFRERKWKEIVPPKTWRRGSGMSLGPVTLDSVYDWMNMREQGYLSWDPDDLLVLARMWQLGDIGSVMKGKDGEAGEKLKQLSEAFDDDDDERFIKALKSIKAKVLLMPCETDQYFPPEDSKIEVKYLKNGQVEVIPSIWGHMAGGGANEVDIKWMNERIEKFMADGSMSEVSEIKANGVQGIVEGVKDLLNVS